MNDEITKDKTIISPSQSLARRALSLDLLVACREFWGQAITFIMLFKMYSWLHGFLIDYMGKIRVFIRKPGNQEK